MERQGRRGCHDLQQVNKVSGGHQIKTQSVAWVQPSFSSYNHAAPAKDPKREFKVGDKIRVNLHHGKIEDAVVRAVIEDDGTKLQVDVVGLDLTALMNTRQVVE